MSRDKGIPLMYMDANGKSMKASLSLSRVNHVLIGLYVDEGRIPSSEILYRVRALIVIFHEERTYFKRCRDLRELTYWVNGFEEYACIIRYTSYDLCSAFRAFKYVPVDFSQIPSTSDDVVSSIIGTETTTAEWNVWECEKTCVEVQKVCDAQTITRTRIAEMFSFIYVFLYNMLIGCFVFPLAPVYSNGVIVFTDLIIVTFLGVNALIPIVFVFWRRFTRRLLTCIYTGLALGGGLLGVMFTLNMTSIPSAIGSLLIIYTFNFFLWTVGIIGIKLCKMALWLMREWEFVR